MSLEPHVIPSAVDRIFLALIGVGGLAMGILLAVDKGLIVRTEGHTGIAPALLIAAGLTTLGWASRSQSRPLYLASAVLVPVSMMARAAQVALTLIDGTDTPFSLAVAGIAWTLMATMAVLIWLKLEPVPRPGG